MRLSRKSVFIISLWLSLWSGQISASETIIRKGERAKVDGVLVPNQNYIYYQEQMESIELYRNELKSLRREKENLRDSLVYGLISGIALTILVYEAND